MINPNAKPIIIKKIIENNYEYTCYYCEMCGLEFCTTEKHTQYCIDCKSDNIYISELTDYINDEDCNA